MKEWASYKLIYTRNKEEENIKLTSFEVITLIGKGSISNVYLLKKKSTGEAFAMKAIKKELILDSNLFESTKLEKELLITVYS
jgi:serine/threonine protein kinase